MFKVGHWFDLVIHPSLGLPRLPGSAFLIIGSLGSLWLPCEVRVAPQSL